MNNQKVRLVKQVNSIILLGVLAGLLSVSCGKKGPLYMPKSEPKAEVQVDTKPIDDAVKKTKSPRGY